MEDGVSRIETRVKIDDALRRRPSPILRRAAPVGTGDDIPVVIWRRERACSRSKRGKRRLLRVFLDPDGWHVMIDGFRETPERSAERMRNQFGQDEIDGIPLTVKSIKDGLIGAPLRLVGDASHVLPLDVETWTRDRFDAGCDCLSHWFAVRDELREDCTAFRATRKRVERRIDHQRAVRLD